MLILAFPKLILQIIQSYIKRSLLSMCNFLGFKKKKQIEKILACGITLSRDSSAGLEPATGANGVTENSSKCHSLHGPALEGLRHFTEGFTAIYGSRGTARLKHVCSIPDSGGE